jgi:hypothetical protein
MPLSIMDGIVLLAVGFALVFFAAWMVSPNLRVWIERPKYRFLADVQSYDEIQRRAEARRQGGGWK